MIRTLARAAVDRINSSYLTGSLTRSVNRSSQPKSRPAVQILPRKESGYASPNVCPAPASCPPFQRQQMQAESSSLSHVPTCVEISATTCFREVFPLYSARARQPFARTVQVSLLQRHHTLSAETSLSTPSAVTWYRSCEESGLCRKSAALEAEVFPIREKSGGFFRTVHDPEGSYNRQDRDKDREKRHYNGDFRVHVEDRRGTVGTDRFLR